MPARPTSTVTAEVTYSCVELGTVSGSDGATGASQLGDRLPERRELDPAADGREHGEDPDGHEHRPGALTAVVVVVVLAHERARLAGEDEEPEPEGVEAGEERAHDAAGVEDVAVPADVEGRRDDRVLREEACERRDPDERERAREETPLRERHHLPEPAHLADVLLVRERMDREARRHEEQRLEEGVRHEVEHPVRVTADPDRR